MPTVQITPGCFDSLQAVADTLGKSRRVVVITGAGISTNSGIPDFRSQNGLYSLIQSQYDKAQASILAQDEVNDFESERPAKRRRTSHDSASAGEDDALAQEGLDIEDAKSADGESSAPESPSLPPLCPLVEDSLREKSIPEQSHPDTGDWPAEPRRLTRSRAVDLPDTTEQHPLRLDLADVCQEAAIPNPGLSTTSSQTDDADSLDEGRDSIKCAPYRTPQKARLAAMFSSSPLSSPPPVLWDPYENALPSTDISSQLASDSSDDSDAENIDHSVNFFSASQGSTARLRTMKGRDLFDSNIWADPVKTSVFYRFATSLRQKVKDIEPTATHRFIAQLRDIGKLARVYTQNIDEIEKKLGLSTDLNHGAGSKRRRPAKAVTQQQLEQFRNEGVPQDRGSSQDRGTKGQDNLLGVGELTKEPEASDAKPSKPTVNHEKGVECVFLHGSLSSLRCFLCGKVSDWDEDDREMCTLSGEQPECPHCAGAAAARVEKGRRALGVGKLRPDIVLYGEEHPQSDLISPIVQHDLSAGPDVLLVLGTSLRVHGLKIMVKEFAKSVHSKGGKVVFVNFTKPSESVWGDVLDYWIEWDCDAWVNDLKERKPSLWLSAEEVQEQDRQRRETIAEKKRESLLRRESTMEKKRESLGEAVHPAVDIVKAPAKNPQSMRNDMQCGVYLAWEIMQTLAKIGDRPFDNLEPVVERPLTRPKETPVPVPTLPAFARILRNEPRLTPAQPTASAESNQPPEISLSAQVTIAQEIATKDTPKQTKRKRARKSSPANISANGSTKAASDAEEAAPVHQSPPSSIQKFRKAVGNLPRSNDTDPVSRLNVLSRPPTPTPPTAIVPIEPEPTVDHSEVSIVAAVKTNPRQRKPKVWYDPTPTREVKQAAKRVLPPPVPSPTVRDHHGRKQDVAGMYGTRTSLPSISIETAKPAPFLEVDLQLSPLQCPTRNIRPAPFVIPEGSFPMSFSDPLWKLGYQGFTDRAVNITMDDIERLAAAKHDLDQAASEQLRREEEAAQTLASFMTGNHGH